jgi:hypothetical protein
VSARKAGAVTVVVAPPVSGATLFLLWSGAIAPETMGPMPCEVPAVSGDVELGDALATGIGKEECEVDGSEEGFGYLFFQNCTR